MTDQPTLAPEIVAPTAFADARLARLLVAAVAVVYAANWINRGESGPPLSIPSALSRLRYEIETVTGKTTNDLYHELWSNR